MSPQRSVGRYPQALARKPKREYTPMYTAEFSALTSADLIEAGLDPNDPFFEKEKSNPNQITFTKGIWWVAAGGAIGGALRYQVGIFLPTLSTFTLADIPWGTLLINTLGCLFLGLLAGVVEVRPRFSERMKLMLGTGFCGGFTTMSAFALENAVLFGSNHPSQAMIYIASTVVLCMLAISLGFYLGSSFAPKKVISETVQARTSHMFEVPSKNFSSNVEEIALNSKLFTESFNTDKTQSDNRGSS